ncbi:MAG: DUF123 domain-containing protein [Chloroflexi bacterium]|nr:DUF123 domain-containing protein [Chloroflexota bacterium]
MSTHPHFPSLVFLGRSGPSGIYLLRLHVTQPLLLALGALHGGRPIGFPPGPYLYVGSALAQRGATSLPRRLLRHATRCAGAPHPLRRPLQLAFPVTSPPARKRLHWHVDYLLEAPAVSLSHALLVYTSRPLERAFAAWVQRRPNITAPVPGAGASDAPGQTHLFAVAPYPGWWADLGSAAARRFAQEL